MSADTSDSKHVHDAFISYSRKNRDFAVRLEKALENYTPPKASGAAQRRLDVFRDEADFTGVDYHTSVHGHLTASAKLIVLCSPDARRSSYVNDEIRRFAQMHGAHNIVPVLVNGIPNNEALPGQQEECAFPEALCEVLEMPLAANYRNFDVKKHRIEKGVFEGSWYTVLANLYGISRALIEDRERKRHAQRRRIRAAVIGSVMAGLAVALVITLISRGEAVRQRGFAEARQLEAEDARDKERKAAEEARKARDDEQVQRERADERSKVALSRQLAAQAVTELRERRLDLALLLSLEAQNAADTLEARSGLLSALVSNPRLITFLRSAAQLTSLSFSRDGKTLAVTGGTQVLLWNTESQRIAGQPFKAEGDRTHSVALRPDAGQVTVGSQPGRQIESWEIQSRRPVRTPLEADDGSPMTVAYSPDGRILATGTDEGRIILSDSETLRPPTARLPGHSGSVSALTFSPDGTMLTSGGVDGKVIVWDAASGQRRLELAARINGGEVHTVAYSPDGRFIASAGTDRKITISDARTGEIDGQPIAAAASFRSVAFSADSKVLAAGSEDGSVTLWNVATRQLLEPALNGHGSAVWAVAFNPAGTTLASGEYDGTVILWDVQRPYRLGQSVGGFAGAVSRVAFSPDGKTLGAADCRPTSVQYRCAGEVHIIDAVKRLRTNAPVASHPGQIQALRFSGDGSRLLSGSCLTYNLVACEGTEVRTWSVFSGRQFGSTRTTDKPGSRLFALAFAPDGETAAAAGCIVGNCDAGDIGLWQFNSGRAPGLRFPKGSGSIDSLVYSPDGRILAATSGSNQTVLWDVQGAKPIGTPLPGSDPAFSADGKLLAVFDGRSRSVVFRDGATGAILGEPVAGLPEIVTSLVFSADSKTLAAAGLDLSQTENGSISLMDVTERRPLGEAWRTGQRINDLAFSPNSNVLVSAGSATVFWDMDPQSWRARACRIANRNLTYSEWKLFLGDVPYRATCNDIAIDFEELASAGSQLARDGNLAGATQVFENIRALRPSPSLDPAQQARKVRAAALVEQAEYVARAGDVDRSVALFRSAIENDPGLNFDPASRAGRLAAPESIARGRDLVQRGLVKEAVAAFALAAKLDPKLEIDTVAWRDLCRFGAAWDKAKDVLFACSRVVAYPYSTAEDRDVRGLARALAGDYRGAIDDIEVFVAARAKPPRRRLNEEARRLRERQIADRQRWLAELRRRTNPYRSEMLDELKKP